MRNPKKLCKACLCSSCRNCTIAIHLHLITMQDSQCRRVQDSTMLQSKFVSCRDALSHPTILPCDLESCDHFSLFPGAGRPGKESFSCLCIRVKRSFPGRHSAVSSRSLFLPFARFIVCVSFSRKLPKMSVSAVQAPVKKLNVETLLLYIYIYS